MYGIFISPQVLASEVNITFLLIVFYSSLIINILSFFLCICNNVGNKMLPVLKVYECIHLVSLQIECCNTVNSLDKNSWHTSIKLRLDDISSFESSVILFSVMHIVLLAVFKTFF